MSCPITDFFGSPIVKKVAIAAAALGAAYAAYRYATAPLPPGRKAKPVDAVDIIVISGPSGVGKGTFITRSQKEHPGALALSVSHTSRAPRAGEHEGVHYWFSSKEEMTAMEKRGEFLEICNVHGNLYGTSFAALDAVRRTGASSIIECDVQGSQKIKEAFIKNKSDMKVAYMFIAPPSIEELEHRIQHRGGETEEKIKTRLQTARREMKFLEAFRGHFDVVLVNDDLEKSYTQFVKFLHSKGIL